MQEKNLNLLRNKINSIDDQILKLIMERSLVVDEIGFFRKFVSVDLVDFLILRYEP